MEHCTFSEESTGIIAINKPYGWSSMDVIRFLRRKTGIKKIGHAGTLDPLATGVLIVCIGRDATKQIESLMDLEKDYSATIDLSAFSDTDDLEGVLEPVEITQQPSMQTIEQMVQSFQGEQLQTPPRFSAIRVEGKRAYERARKGQDFRMPPRSITIHSIAVQSFEWPLLKIKVSCSKGTYIRSLARDIGKKLNTGGHLVELIRTAVGPYTVDNACIIESESDEKKNVTRPGIRRASNRSQS